MLWIPMVLMGAMIGFIIVREFYKPKELKELTILIQDLHWLKALTLKERAENPDFIEDVPEKILRTTHNTMQNVYLKGYFYALSQVVNEIKLNPRDIIEDWSMIEAALERYDKDLEEADNQNNPKTVSLKNSPSTENK